MDIKSRIVFFIWWLTIIPILVSCSYSEKDFEFNIKDRDLFSTYKVGDTIYFYGSNNDKDTFMIFGIDSSEKRSPGFIMALPSYHNLNISIQHLPYDHWTIKTTTDTNIVIEHPEIISVLKLPQTKKTEYIVQFKNFFCSKIDSLGELHLDTVIINNKKITNYYLLSNDYIERDKEPYHIELIYWSKRDGMIAYKCKNGVLYSKIYD